MMILVAGLPGSGKSYFARHLAKLLDAQYINSDQVRDQMGARGKYSLEDRELIYHEMAILTQQKLHLTRWIVLDATFYLEKIRQIFYEIAADNLDTIYLIEVIAEENLIRQRLEKPREDSEADLSVYQKLKDQFEPINEYHLTLHSRNDNIAEMLEQAMAHIYEKNARK